MDLLLIRHAEPVRIAPGEVDGLADPVLTERGRLQAAALAAWLADEPLDAIITSPLLRAVETAAPLAAAHGIIPRVVEGVAEFDRNAGFYLTVEEMRRNKDPRLAQMVAGDLSSYGVADPGEFHTRVVSAVDEVVNAHPGGSVAIVCHGGVINAYTSAVASVPRMLWFDVDYTGISRVQASRSGVRTIRSLNETGHLRGTQLLPNRAET